MVLWQQHPSGASCDALRTGWGQGGRGGGMSKEDFLDQMGNFEYLHSDLYIYNDAEIESWRHLHSLPYRV